MSQQALYYILLAGISVLSLIGMGWVLFTQDPVSVGLIGAMYFFIALFATTISALLLFWLRQVFGQREKLRAHFWTSIRQGFWVAALLALSLLLSSQGLFTWYNSGFLVVALIFLETFFLYNERKTRTN